MAQKKRKRQLIEEFDPESFPRRGRRKRGRIHGSYLGATQYERMLEEAEPPKYQKRKVEQERIRRRKRKKKKKNNNNYYED